MILIYRFQLLFDNYTRFYRDPSGRLALIDNGFCHEWAERASRVAFEEAQFPREENVATLINLALFWYSEGEFRRSAMHECKILDRSHDDYGIDDGQAAQLPPQSLSASLQSKKARRIHWNQRFEEEGFGLATSSPCISRSQCSLHHLMRIS
jgi:hypothetical protein